MLLVMLILWYFLVLGATAAAWFTAYGIGGLVVFACILAVSTGINAGLRS